MQLNYSMRVSPHPKPCPFPLLEKIEVLIIDNRSQKPGSHISRQKARRTSNFDGKVVGDHAVPGCKIPVHELLSIQVCHPIGDLCRHLNHFLQGRGRAAGVILKLKQGGHVQPHMCLRPRGAGCPARYLETAHLSLRPQGTEVTLQVSVSHQLHHHQRWLAFGHHPQEADLWNKQGPGRFLNEGL